MGETPNIPAQVPEAASTLARPARGAVDARTSGPAFEALLERLVTTAAELEQRSKSLSSPAELPDAVDAAKASLEDALTLGEQLLEAYRASLTGPADWSERPVTHSIDLREEALGFLGRVLGDGDLAAEHPLVFDARFTGETIEHVESGEVRAACAVLVREFRIGERRVRGGLIGSVATDPSCRKRGLATRLLLRAESVLAERGCTFALLWADDPRFYLARGYAPFGVECDYLLVPELVPGLPEPDGVRAFRRGDEPFLARLYERHPARVERTLDETIALLAVPGMLTLVRERAAAPGQPTLPVAYACLGRGRDLADGIHEWAGQSEDVLCLVRAHLERRQRAGEGGALFLMAPPQAGELGYRLLRQGALSRRGILGLGKILDSRAAGWLLAEVLGDPSCVLPAAAGIQLRGPRAGADLDLDLDTLQALLFGGPDVRDEVRSFLGRAGFEHVRLPLEPFAFGLDSI